MGGYVAKTRSTKRANTEARNALKGLRSELKRLGKAVSKQIRAGSSKGPKKRSGSATRSGSVTTAAKRTSTKARTAAKKTTKAATKRAAPKAR
jgi:hypothetical protein